VLIVAKTEVAMDRGHEVILGYVLLCIGLTCMAFALLCAYQIFTNVKSPPEIFQMESAVFSVSPYSNAPAVETKILLDPSIKTIVNMLLYYMLMFFILSAGAKLSALGIQLLRRIKVVVRDK
jgi:hypothetical protein